MTGDAFRKHLESLSIEPAPDCGPARTVQCIRSDTSLQFAVLLVKKLAAGDPAIHGITPAWLARSLEPLR